MGSVEKGVKVRLGAIYFRMRSAPANSSNSTSTSESLRRIFRPQGEAGGKQLASPAAVALRAVLVYAVAAALWMGFSDAWLRHFVSERATVDLVALKGGAFVVVTSVVFFVLLRRELRRSRVAMEARVEMDAASRLWADVFASCSHGIVVSDPRTNVTTACNPAFARLMGRRVEELIGQPVLERYGPESLGAVKAALAEADRTGSVRFELTIRSSEGDSRDVQVDIAMVRDASGQWLHRVGTMQDITERKRAERALRESELSMTEAQHVGGFGSWTLELTDADVLENNRVTWTNQCCRILGREPGELPMTMQVFMDHVHPEDRQRVREAAMAAIFDLQSYRMEHRIVAKDGTVRHVLSTGEVSGEMEPMPRFRFVGTIHDVTERVRTEAALRESEERFRAVVENIHEVFWMREVPHNRVLYVSPNYEAVWGRPGADLMDNPMAWFEAVHDEDKSRVAAKVGELERTGFFDDEYRIVRPDGTVRWIWAKAFPVDNVPGEIVRVVGVADDVTERKTLEAQFLRAQRMEVIGTLAGGIAHDLNNILSPMLMAAALLKESSSDPRARDMLSMVETNARRGADIIRQLLTFSRGAGGKRTPIKLKHLAREICSIIRETFPREIALDANVAGDAWPVVADTRCS